MTLTDGLWVARPHLKLQLKMYAEGYKNGRGYVQLEDTDSAEQRNAQDGGDLWCVSCCAPVKGGWLLPLWM